MGLVWRASSVSLVCVSSLKASSSCSSRRSTWLGVGLGLGLGLG